MGTKRRVEKVSPFVGIGTAPPPPLVPGGGAHSLAGEGVVGPNSDAGTYTVVPTLCIYVLCVSKVIFAEPEKIEKPWRSLL